MTIGQKLMVSKKVHTQSGTTPITLSWGDDNVQLFEGASGAKNVYLPAGDISNNYGEVWISNSQAAGDIVIQTDTAATGNVQNLHGDSTITISAGETAHMFYVPYLRNTAKPLDDDKVDGQKRGMWIGGLLNKS